MSRLTQFLRLYTGARIPAIGLGTFENTADVEHVVEYALDVGYRHIDTAAIYGNEGSIGNAIQRYLRSGKLKRDDLFLTTKVPSYKMENAKAVMESARESLDLLRVQYVDMLLLHMPFGFEHGPDKTKSLRILRHYDLGVAWGALEELCREGKTKAIGLSNFNIDQIHRILRKGQIKPANLQLECHAYLQQRELRAYCKEKDIVMTAYSPLGAPGRPERMRQAGDKELIQDPLVTDIASATGLSKGQVLLKFLMQLGLIPLPKTVSLPRLKENLQAMTSEDIVLDPVSMKKLDTLHCGQRYYRFPWAQEHPEYDKNKPF